MRFSLATNFSVTILGVVALALVSSLVTLFATWRIQIRLGEIGRDNMPPFSAAGVENSVLEINRMIAAGLLEPNHHEWEERLRALQRDVNTRIVQAGEAATDEDEEIELQKLKTAWEDLEANWERIISLENKGEHERAKAALLADVNGRLLPKIQEICRRLADLRDQATEYRLNRAHARLLETKWVVGVSSALTLLLGGFLLWLFFYRVIFPLRGMVADTKLYAGERPIQGTASGQDELRIVASHLRNLMSDVNDAQSHLERSRNQLMVAEKLAGVGKLAANVAHEIRNPLTAMKMWLFSIRETTPGNADVERKLTIVSEEIARLEDILRNFLEFARPLTLKCRPQSVTAVIDQVLELVKPRLCARGILIHYHAPQRLPPILGDANQLKQVLLNLLGNAEDAQANQGEIRIVARAEKDAGGRSIVVVRVSDTGTGMPPDVQERLFEPFFTTKEKGTGLGLCIAAQVMARHGGALLLESSSEKGTTFAIQLPVAEESDAQNTGS
jgi:signal transduction histidine kinase